MLIIIGWIIGLIFVIGGGVWVCLNHDERTLIKQQIRLMEGKKPQEHALLAEIELRSCESMGRAARIMFLAGIVIMILLIRHLFA